MLFDIVKQRTKIEILIRNCLRKERDNNNITLCMTRLFLLLINLEYV